MSYLTYNNQLRIETDSIVISNLIRKGWVEITKPSDTSYWQNGQWVEPSQQELDNQQRATERSALRQQWEALPSFIKGPYKPEFEAANRLLEEGDDESAIAMIELAEPKTLFTEEQLSVFETTKQTFKTAIESLPRI